MVTELFLSIIIALLFSTAGYFLLARCPFSFFVGMDYQLLAKLTNVNYLRKVIVQGSQNCPWWKKLFSDRFIKVVSEARRQYGQELIEIFVEGERGFGPEFLREGGLYEEAVLKELDFSTLGRTVASLALVCFIFEKLQKHTGWSDEDILSLLVPPLCSLLEARMMAEQVRQGLCIIRMPSAEREMLLPSGSSGSGSGAGTRDQVVPKRPREQEEEEEDKDGMEASGRRLEGPDLV